MTQYPVDPDCRGEVVDTVDLLHQAFDQRLVQSAQGREPAAPREMVLRRAQLRAIEGQLRGAIVGVILVPTVVIWRMRKTRSASKNSE